MDVPNTQLDKTIVENYTCSPQGRSVSSFFARFCDGACLTCKPLMFKVLNWTYPFSMLSRFAPRLPLAVVQHLHLWYVVSRWFRHRQSRFLDEPVAQNTVEAPSGWFVCPSGQGTPNIPKPSLRFRLEKSGTKSVDASVDAIRCSSDSTATNVF